jgi:hypothetical protein
VLQREYRPWDEPILSLDGLRPIDENLARILDYVLGGGSAASR